jgi:hypothetical protein
MTPVKRIEIVLPDVLLRDVLALLKQHGAGGWTVTRGLSGRGDRGMQSGDGGVGEVGNASVLVACPPDTATPLLEALRPLLARHGGMCLVSDAQWLKH